MAEIEQEMIEVPEQKLKSNKALWEIYLILFICLGIYLFSGKYDIFEKIHDFSMQHEEWEIDELLTVSISFVIFVSIFALRRWKEAMSIRLDLEKQNIALHSAIKEIQQLKSVLPICCKCKKIRDDDGYWHQVEAYISDHSSTEFSHSLCPNCKDQLYPEQTENGDTSP